MPAKTKEQQRIARIRNHPANKAALKGVKRKYVRKPKVQETTYDDSAKLVEAVQLRVDRLSARVDGMLPIFQALDARLDKHGRDIMGLKFPAKPIIAAGNREEDKSGARRDLWNLAQDCIVNDQLANMGIQLPLNFRRAPDWRSELIRVMQRTIERLGTELTKAQAQGSRSDLPPQGAMYELLRDIVGTIDGGLNKESYSGAVRACHEVQAMAKEMIGRKGKV